MITHETVSETLRTLGYTVGLGKSKARLKLYAAVHEDLGVRFKWFVCNGDDQESLNSLAGVGENLVASLCPHHQHIHAAVSIRTGAGGRFGSFGPWFVLTNLDSLEDHRGAPPTRTQISRKALPTPYKFKKERLIISGKKYIRTGVISTAKLVNVVGIQDNAKIDPDMAAKPDEPVWFHFDCEGYAGATFDIITDGEYWYPINRKSHRITTQLKPKKSVDLSDMSIIDQEFLHEAIQDFASKV